MQDTRWNRNFEETFFETESYPANKFFPVINRIKHYKNNLSNWYLFISSEIIKNQRFSDFFRVYTKRPVPWNGLTEATLLGYPKKRLYIFLLLLLKFCTLKKTLLVHFNVLLVFFRTALENYIICEYMALYGYVAYKYIFMYTLIKVFRVTA